MSSIVLDSLDDSVAVQVGSSREELCVPSEIVGVGSPSTTVTDAALLADSPLPSAEFLLQDLQWAPAAPRPQDVIGNGDGRLGRAHFWLSGRLPCCVRLAPDAHVD